jgi:hypothetical protein
MIDAKRTRAWEKTRLGRQHRFAAVVSSKCCQWLFDLTATDTRWPEVLASSATLIRIDLSCRIDW